MFGGVGETLEHQWGAACFLKNAQISGMSKQGLHSTWILPLTVLQTVKNKGEQVLR